MRIRSIRVDDSLSEYFEIDTIDAEMKIETSYKEYKYISVSLCCSSYTYRIMDKSLFEVSKASVNTKVDKQQYGSFESIPESNEYLPYFKQCVRLIKMFKSGNVTTKLHVC